MAVAEVKERVVAIPKLNIREMRVPIEGISPLMQNKPIPKALKDKDLSPEEECEMRAWEMEKPKDGYKYGHPANGLKASIISAARTVSSTNMKELAQTFQVIADDPSACVPLDTSGYVMDTRHVTIRRQGMVEWHRPRYDDWAMTIDLIYDADAISGQELVGLIARAGNFVGIGTFRPEKQAGHGGPFGRFRVAGQVTEE